MSDKDEKRNEKFEKREAKERRSNIIHKTIAGLIFFVGISFLVYIVIATNRGAQPVNYESKVNPESLAKCLTDKGIKMYGEDWCPHCKEQKAWFGEAFKYVTYINCEFEKDKCTEAGITGYPTWITDDGRKLAGGYPLDLLAEETGCP